MAETAPNRPGISRLLLPSVVGGFVIAVLMWAGWFVTHLPEISLSTPAAAVVLGLMLLSGAVLAGRWAGGRSGWKVGLGAGLVASLINLMLLGSFVASPESVPEPVPVAERAEGLGPDAGSGSGAGESSLETGGTSMPQGTSEDSAATDRGGLRPDTPVIVLGFLATGLVVGALGGLLGGLLAHREDERGEALDPRPWLFRFSLTAWAITLLLILIGGLVTSTESGLAVPDWPTSYGANMFLYPIGLMAHPRIFLEHSHRLFGSLAGLTTLVLMLAILVHDRRGWTKIWAIGLVVLVIVQGTMGGLRVEEKSAAIGIVHGVLAQIFLAMLAMQAAWHSPLWNSMDPASMTRYGRAKKLATALTHATVLQLAMGAAFRHLSAEGLKGASHALWTHVGFSLVVVIFAALAAAAAMGDPEEGEPRRSILKRCGAWIIGIVGLQFALGWAALWAVTTSSDRGPVPTAAKLADAEPVPMVEVLLATSHQANGALLLSAAAVTMLWARMGRKPGSAGAGRSEPTPGSED